jgi:hypothetical protein
LTILSPVHDVERILSKYVLNNHQTFAPPKGSVVGGAAKRELLPRAMILLERIDTHTSVRKRVFERDWEPRGFIEFIDIFIREKISWKEQQRIEQQRIEIRNRNQRQ